MRTLFLLKRVGLYSLVASLSVFSLPALAVDIVDFSKESPQLQVKRIREQNADQQLQIEALQRELLRLQGKLEQYQYRLDSLAKAFDEEKAARVGQAQVSAAPVVNTPAVAATAPVVDNDADVYQLAFDALKAKSYQSAKTKFDAYLQQFPNGQYAANAHYWLGEIHFVGDDNAAAEKAFQTVIRNYPTSSKIEDSRLKMAEIYSERGEHEKAKGLLKHLMSASNTNARTKTAAKRLWNDQYAN